MELSKKVFKSFRSLFLATDRLIAFNAYYLLVAGLIVFMVSCFPVTNPVTRVGDTHGAGSIDDYSVFEGIPADEIVCENHEIEMGIDFRGDGICSKNYTKLIVKKYTGEFGTEIRHSKCLDLRTKIVPTCHPPYFDTIPVSSNTDDCFCGVDNGKDFLDRCDWFCFKCDEGERYDYNIGECVGVE